MADSSNEAYNAGLWLMQSIESLIQERGPFGPEERAILKSAEEKFRAAL